MKLFSSKNLGYNCKDSNTAVTTEWLNATTIPEAAYNTPWHHVYRDYRAGESEIS